MFRVRVEVRTRTDQTNPTMNPNPVPALVPVRSPPDPAAWPAASRCRSVAGQEGPTNRISDRIQNFTVSGFPGGAKRNLKDISRPAARTRMNLLGRIKGRSFSILNQGCIKFPRGIKHLIHPCT